MTGRALRDTASAALLAIGLALAWRAPASAAPAQHSFSWVIADRGAVSDLNVTSTFHTDIINTGTATDTYRISLQADLPATWLTTMCDVGLCYPPFVTTLEYTVAPGDTLYLGVNITPMIDAGAGVSTVTVGSLGAPAQNLTAGFAVLTPGADVLVVAADGIGGVPAAVTGAVAAAGRTAAVWDRGAHGKLSPSELAAFAAVVWHAGDNPFGLDADDRTALAGHVAAGGRVLIGGANLAFLRCDPASAWYEPAAVVWFADALGVGYAANASGSFQVAGAPGDPVGAGLAFAIDGGGANALPDVLIAQGGVACLRYAGGDVSGVRRQSDAGRTLFLGFGIAGIADAASRAAFMSAALDWLVADASTVPAATVPAVVTLRAAPNPFNPRTTVRVDNAGLPIAACALDVYDLRGRLVRALHRGPLAAGSTVVVWDGRDDSGRALPAGPYLARLVLSGAADVTIKLLLAK